MLASLQKTSVFSVSKQPEGMRIIIFKYTLASMNINI